MTFGELQVGERFTRGNDLVWTKEKPFTAYGCVKNQNASALAYRQWHYDNISEGEVVTLVPSEPISA